MLIFFLHHQPVAMGRQKIGNNLFSVGVILNLSPKLHNYNFYFLAHLACGDVISQMAVRKFKEGFSKHNFQE